MTEVTNVAPTTKLVIYHRTSGVKNLQTIIPGREHCRRKWKNEKTKSETSKLLKTLRSRVTVEKRNHKFFFWTWANRVKHWQYFRQEQWRKEALLLIKKAIFVYAERKKYNGWYSTKNIYTLLVFYKNVNREPEFLEEGEIYKNKLHLKYTSSTLHNPEAIHSNSLQKQPNNKYVVLQSGCEPEACTSVRRCVWNESTAASDAPRIGIKPREAGCSSQPTLTPT